MPAALNWRRVSSRRLIRRCMGRIMTLRIHGPIIHCPQLRRPTPPLLKLNSLSPTEQGPSGSTTPYCPWCLNPPPGPCWQPAALEFSAGVASSAVGEGYWLNESTEKTQFRGEGHDQK